MIDGFKDMIESSGPNKSRGRGRVLSVLMMLMAVLSVQVRGDQGMSLVRARLPEGARFADLIDQGIDVLAVNRDGSFDMAVTPGQLEWLHSVQRPGRPGVEVLGRPMSGAAAGLDGDLGGYHTYDETLTALAAMASGYPSLAMLDTIGTTHEGRLIAAVKISDNVYMDEDETEVLIVGCHHARELMSVEVPLMLGQYLLSNYGVSSFVTSMVDSREIWIVPMLNPDGHVYVQNNHSDDWWTWWRKNRRDNGDGTYGVDLNRNYGHQWGYDDEGSSPDPASLLYRGPSAFSEPETQAIRDLCASRGFSVALSYHSYGELLIYPWGYAPLVTGDHELFKVLGDSLARGNDYAAGCTATGILYPVNGDSDDWMYGETYEKDRIYSYTVELNTYEEGGFGPPDSMIAPTFEKVLGLNFTVLSTADDPHKVLGPLPPAIDPVTGLASSQHLVSWSGPQPGDPNFPVSWEVVEYAGISPGQDAGSPGGTVWALDGFTLSSARYDSPPECYYSGRADGVVYTMQLADPYPLNVFGQSFQCRMWYEIESGWDYAYLEESYDGGLTWSTCMGNVTTTSDPNGNNRGFGITGSSGGWIDAQFHVGPLVEPHPGATVLLRFVYRTDSYVNEEGLYIDDISPVPSYGSRVVLAPAHPDTFLVREPDSLGTYAYMVRARDIDGHASRWSGMAFHTASEYVDSDQAPPAESRLESVYPNPFNPSTSIRFTVGSLDAGVAASDGASPALTRGSGRVRVRAEVFDIAGRLVAVLEDGLRETGTHTVTWDGRSSSGTAAASGIYFFRITVGSRSFSMKAVLLR